MFRFIYGLILVFFFTLGTTAVIREAETKEEIISGVIIFLLYVPFTMWLIFN